MVQKLVDSIIERAANESELEAIIRAQETKDARDDEEVGKVSLGQDWQFAAKVRYGLVLLASFSFSLLRS
jgi:hypothetical protein